MFPTVQELMYHTVHELLHPTVQELVYPTIMSCVCNVSPASGICTFCEVELIWR